MRIVAITGVVLAAIAASLAPVVGTVYGEAFPSDSAKAAALEACAGSDPGFNRLIAAERRACYEHSRNAQPARPSGPATAPGASMYPTDAG